MTETTVPVTIFWRIMLGSLTILLLSVGISFFAILQLGGFSRDASAVLNKDNRIILYEEKLTEALLSEVRYAGKFIITQASTHYEQSKQFRKDFLRYMAEIVTLTSLPDIQSRLSRIKDYHDRYGDLYEQEVRYLKNGQPYAESRYKQEKERVLDSALKELERLKAQLQQNLHSKLERMEKAGRTARKIASLATLIVLVLGMTLAFVVSKSITTSLVKLTQRIMSETEEDTGAVSRMSHVPEIERLSLALKREKDKLRDATERNADFVNSISENVITPLVSLQKRLGYLQTDLTQPVTQEQRTSLKILENETEQLIQRCVQLRLPPGMKVNGVNRQTQRGNNDAAISSRRISSFNDASNYLRWTRFSLASFATYGVQLATGSWHLIYQSLRTIKHGKARK